MSFPEHWPPIEIKKQKNQVNLRLSIRNNRILLTGPLRSSDAELKKFALDHSTWIEKVLVKKAAQVPLPAVEENEHKLFLGGKWISFVLQTHASNRIYLDPESGVLTAKVPVDLNKTPLKSVKEVLYKYMAQLTLPKEFASFAKMNGFNYDRLFIRSQKTKWGTCSSKTNISFNWRLVKCPLEVRYYLYAHEASHLVHLNHSKEFWALVKHYDPDYKKHEKWLKENEQFLFLID